MSVTSLVAYGLGGLLILALTYVFSFSRGQIRARPGARVWLWCLLACGSLVVSHFALESVRYARRLPKTDFAGVGDLVVPSNLNPSGSTLAESQSVRTPKPISRDLDVWKNWQRELRQDLAARAYRQAASTGVAEVPAELVREQVDDGLLRREFVVAADDGDKIPLVVLTPDGERSRKPAVLVVHGHVLDGNSGLAQMVLPVRSYMRSAARELAKAGFVTAVVELRGFGMRGPPEHPDHRIVAYNAILAGSFYKQLAVSDLNAVLDVLSTLEDVDKDRLGITGVSLGAEIAVELAAMSQRIKVISFHSHGGQVGAFHGRKAPNTAQPHYCHLIPGVVSLMHREDPFLLLAPRPTQGLRSQGEPFASSQFRPALEQLWSIFEAKDVLDLRQLPTVSGRRDHTYYVEEAIEFFSEHL